MSTLVPRLDRLVGAVVRAYFQLAYGLLASASGRLFFRLTADPGGTQVYGYTTRDDLDALVADLQPSSADLVLDLGCGFGDVAIEVHRRTGCRVLGIDISARAIRASRRRAAERGVAKAVRFVVGDLADPPPGASAAFALDSLMFLRQPARVLARVATRLGVPGRIFATFVDFRGLQRDEISRCLREAGLEVQRLDDVTAALRDRSRQRLRLSHVLRARPGRHVRGRLGLRLVDVEERLMLWLTDHGHARRWRVVVASTGTGSAG